MSASRYHLFDPLFASEQAEALWRLCENFGSYGMYSEEGTSDDWGTRLPQRYDAAFNFVSSGGRFSRKEPPEVLAARTNYFRETYAYREKIQTPEIEPFHRFEGFIESARALYGRPIVRPAISYANLLVPGQELAIHTDVPEFRGMSRMSDPQWLLVAMHHSGLFERWRMPIATAVAYFGTCQGGEFAFYPQGPDGAPCTLQARHNTAVLLDTDSIFHGVDRVREDGKPLPALRPGMHLSFEAGDTWRVGSEDETLARYRSDEIRFSISWKGYCFADEAEERAAREHTDDIHREQAVSLLLEDLLVRGREVRASMSRRELALLMIDEYIQLPPATAAEPA